MKKLFYSCILLSSLSFAQTQRVEVASLNFDYVSPRGEGTAAVFTRSQTPVRDGAKVFVEKIGEDFKIIVEGTRREEFDVKKAPAFFLKAESMNLRNANLSLSSTVKLSLLSGLILNPKNALSLESLYLDCDRLSAPGDLADQLIKGCIQRMGLQAAKFISESRGQETLVEALSGAIAATLNQRRAFAGADIRSVGAAIRNGSYNAEATVKLPIVTGKVKSNGLVSYDDAGKVFTIRVNEIKYGIFNITSRVFDELKKHESDRLKVRKPFIYYSIK